MRVLAERSRLLFPCRQDLCALAVTLMMPASMCSRRSALLALLCDAWDAWAPEDAAGRDASLRPGLAVLLADPAPAVRQAAQDWWHAQLPTTPAGRLQARALSACTFCLCVTVSQGSGCLGRQDTRPAAMPRSALGFAVLAADPALAVHQAAQACWHVQCPHASRQEV
jgi:hypothetical protein